MSRYKLDIYEKVSKSHEVIIDTDKDIDAICDEIESHTLGINSVWDIQYIDGVTVIKVIEDESGDVELEVEGICEDDEENEDERTDGS